MISTSPGLLGAALLALMVVAFWRQVLLFLQIGLITVFLVGLLHVWTALAR